MSVSQQLSRILPNQTVATHPSVCEAKRVLFVDRRALFLFSGESDPGPTWRLLRKSPWR